MNIGDRIKKYREYLSVSQVDFAKSIEMKQGSYSDIERGRSKGFSNDKLELIGKTYKSLNLNWLLTGEGDMLVSANKDTKTNASSSAPIVGISSSDELIRSQQETIDRLSRIIENLTKK